MPLMFSLKQNDKQDHALSQRQSDRRSGPQGNVRRHETQQRSAVSLSADRGIPYGEVMKSSTCWSRLGSKNSRSTRGTSSNDSRSHVCQSRFDCAIEQRAAISRRFRIPVVVHSTAAQPLPRAIAGAPNEPLPTAWTPLPAAIGGRWRLTSANAGSARSSSASRCRRTMRQSICSASWWHRRRRGLSA